MAADLHLHTLFSDGTYTPEELAGEAHRHGLGAVALTDHDTVEGCARMAAACRTHALRFVPGSELTAEMAGAELHILAYGVHLDHPELLAKLARCQEVRQERIREMVERLNRLGIPLAAEEVAAVANCRSPGRPHVARALVARGFCRTVEDAFDRFLKRDRPAWVPKFKIDAPDAIGLVHRAGGLAVLAHPGLSRVDPLIPTLVETGLDGIECFHTRHSPATAAYYVEVAEAHRLLITGGSDCHGLAKGEPLIGSVRLSMDHVDRLEAALALRKNPPTPSTPR